LSTQYLEQSLVISTDVSSFHRCLNRCPGFTYKEGLDREIDDMTEATDTAMLRDEIGGLG
jgi:hypothetical protein